MHSIRVHAYGGRDVLRLEEVPVPEPGAGYVLVRNEAIGVNFVDIYKRRGWYPAPLPATPGAEGAGTVVAAGPGTDAPPPGSRVAYFAGLGSYAGYTLVEAAQLVPVPEGITTAEAAAALLQGLTAHSLATSVHPLALGEWCLVHAAAGGVGRLLCQIARRRGARVVGTVSTEAKAEIAREAGAEEVILYTHEDVPSAVRRLTGGAGVRVVYDSVGRDTFDGSLDSLTPRGLLVLFGQASGPVPPVDPQVLNRKGSLYLTRPTLAHYVATPGELKERARDLFAWIADGTLTLRVDSELPLSKAAEAHRLIEERETSGKVLLIP